MSRPVTSVIGVPICDNVRHLGSALDTLLGQVQESFAVVVVDDSQSDEPGAIVRAYAAADARLTYERNPRRLGLIANWRRAYALARGRHPEASYFAWGSDHDLWEPAWLSSLRAELDANPAAVLAYPLNDTVTEAGDVSRGPWRFSTSGQQRPVRFVRVLRRMVAGDMVYGLFRTSALERCGVLRDVLMPDRLLLAELALHGEFRQVPELLWHRRRTNAPAPSPLTRGPQLFADDRAERGTLPWWLDHARAIARAEGMAAAVAYAGLVPTLHVARRLQRAVHPARQRLSA